MAAPQPRSGEEHRETLLRDARRRLAQLEIETRRLRAELARLEAAGEEEAAARLAEQLKRDEERLAAGPEFFESAQQSLSPNEEFATRGFTPTPIPFAPSADEAEPRDQGKKDGEFAERIELKESAKPSKNARTLKSGLPAWWVSLLTHAVIFLLLGLVTFAIQQDERHFLHANTLEGEDAFDDFAEVSLDLPELELDEITDELDPAELSESLTEELQAPWESAALGLDAEAPSALDALPTDLAGLMTGESGGAPDGSMGAEKNPSGRTPASAQFFGSRSRGNRFVFVVDNSGSMVEGRMETTIMELLRSIGSMKPDQHFHVLFYSDQVYPMFFPEPPPELIPATRDNRRRLEAWLGTVQMCRGGSLKDAMDYAASLKPQVLYLLSDGDFLFLTRNGQRTKSRTLEYLTEETGDWPFVVHTLGMTVRDQDSAEALALIARAHGGAFTPVGVNRVAAQLARQRRIPYNRTRGEVWGTKVR